jgi:hypothetical protein
MTSSSESSEACSQAQASGRDARHVEKCRCAELALFFDFPTCYPFRFRRPGQVGLPSSIAMLANYCTLW